MTTLDRNHPSLDLDHPECPLSDVGHWSLADDEFDGEDGTLVFEYQWDGEIPKPALFLAIDWTQDADGEKRLLNEDEADESVALEWRAPESGQGVVLVRGDREVDLVERQTILRALAGCLAPHLDTLVAESPMTPETDAETSPTPSP